MEVSPAKWLRTAPFWGHYAADSGNFLPTIRDNLSDPSSRIKNPLLTPAYGTDRLSRNVGRKLSLLAVYKSRIAQFSIVPRDCSNEFCSVVIMPINVTPLNLHICRTPDLAF